HHWWNGHEIERLQATDNNFLFYPSGDSHPSTEGHTKATAEFVPLLNVFYNRWQAAGPVAPLLVEEPPPAEAEPPAAQETPAPATSPPTYAHPPVAGSETIETFEGEFVWFADAQEQATVVACEPAPGASYGGSTAMQMTYRIPAGEWGGCWRYYDAPQDWRDTTGLTLWLHAAAPDTPFTLIVFSGEFDAPTPFEIALVAPAEWTQLTLRWTDIGRADWADADSLPLIDPARITSLGFSLSGVQGDLWIDDVAVFSGELLSAAPPAPEQPTQAATTAEESAEQPSAPPAEPTETPRGRSGLCASAPLALMTLAVGLVAQRRRVRNA
ncbi:MAG: hypothetical protein JXB47_01470, partial [Anaerolineae bacterium]|nr:hypothetical protein [Anaerolineae bacterium]